MLSANLARQSFNLQQGTGKEASQNKYDNATFNRSAQWQRDGGVSERGQQGEEQGTGEPPGETEARRGPKQRAPPRHQREGRAVPPAGEDTRPHGAPRCRAGLHAPRVKDAWAENLGCGSTWSHACHSPLSGGRRQPRGLSRGCSPCNSGFLFPSPAPCGAGMPPSPIPSSSPAPPEAETQMLPP